MTQKSFYVLLQVDQNATLGDIKLAFKRRALQVHPDKGGSKEEFQLVYQAFETLVDPRARQKYDTAATSPMSKPGAKMPKATAKASAKPKAAKPAGSQPGDRAKRQGCEGAGDPPDGQQATSKSWSRQTKLLIRIHALLKQLPRDVRNDVIIEQFSQKQRLILEKWMVDSDTSSKTPACTEQNPALATNVGPYSTSKDQSDEPSQTLALQLPLKHGQAKCRSRSKKMNVNKKVRATGNLKKGFSMANGTDGYSARICFDALELSTRYSNLQTALEFLVILTSVKQKMQDRTNTKDIPFEELLQGALMASAAEQGRNLADLNMRFAVFQSVGFLIGKGFQLRSPIVHNIADFAKLRNCFEPFRQYVKNLGSTSMYCYCSPAHLQDEWEQFLSAVAFAWKIAGADSSGYIQKLRTYHQATASVRSRHLQAWEGQHMSKHDKNYKHCRKGLREEWSNSPEQRERQQMTMHDKNKHRQKGFRVPLNKKMFRRFSTLSTLLSRWQLMLNQEAQRMTKERLKGLRQKKLKLRKQKEEQRRSEALNQKRLREEERARRESLRKRMRSFSFMNDIHWVEDT